MKRQKDEQHSKHLIWGWHFHAFDCLWHSTCWSFFYFLARSIYELCWKINSKLIGYFIFMISWWDYWIAVRTNIVWLIAFSWASVPINILVVRNLFANPHPKLKSLYSEFMHFKCRDFILSGLKIDFLCLQNIVSVNCVFWICSRKICNISTHFVAMIWSSFVVFIHSSVPKILLK